MLHAVVMCCTCLIFLCCEWAQQVELAINFCPPTHPTSHLQEPCKNLLDGGSASSPFFTCRSFFTCRITCGSPLRFLEQRLLDVCMLEPTGGSASSLFFTRRSFFTCRITCGSPLRFLEQHLLDVCMLEPTVCSPCFTEKKGRSMLELSD